MATSNERSRYRYGICTNREKNEEGKQCSKFLSREKQRIRSGQDFVCEECGCKLTPTTPPSDPKMKIIIIVVAVLVLLGIGGYFAFSGNGETEPKEEEVKDTITVEKVEETDSIAVVKDIDLTNLTLGEPSETIDMLVGEERTIAIVKNPETSNETIEWTSSNKDVVSVDENGVLTAIAEGNVEIKASSSRTQFEVFVNVSVSKENTEPEPKKAVASGNEVVTKNLGYAVYKGRLKNGKMHDNNGVLTFKSNHVIEPRDVKGRKAQAGEKVVGIFENGHLVTGTWYKKDGSKEVIIP